MSKVKIREIIFLSIVGVLTILGLVSNIIMMTQSNYNIVGGVFGIILLLGFVALAVLHFLKIGKGMWNYIPILSLIAFGIVSIISYASFKMIIKDQGMSIIATESSFVYDLFLGIGILELVVGIGLIVATILKKPFNQKQINLFALVAILLPLIVNTFVNFASSVSFITNIIESEMYYHLNPSYLGNDFFLCALLLAASAIINYFVQNKKVAKTIATILTSIVILLSVLGLLVFFVGENKVTTNIVGVNIMMLFAAIGTLIVMHIAHKKQENTKLYMILSFVIMGIALMMFFSSIVISGEELDFYHNIVDTESYILPNVSLFLSSLATLVIILLYAYKDNLKKSDLLIKVLAGILLVYVIVNIANNNMSEVLILLSLVAFYKLTYVREEESQEDNQEEVKEERKPLQLDYGMILATLIAFFVSFVFVMSAFSQVSELIKVMNNSTGNIDDIINRAIDPLIGIFFVSLAIVLPLISCVFTLIKKERQYKLLTLSTLVTNLLVCFSLMTFAILSFTSNTVPYEEETVSISNIVAIVYTSFISIFFFIMAILVLRNKMPLNKANNVSFVMMASMWTTIGFSLIIEGIVNGRGSALGSYDLYFMPIMFILMFSMLIKGMFRKSKLTTYIYIFFAILTSYIYFNIATAILVLISSLTLLVYVRDNTLEYVIPAPRARGNTFRFTRGAWYVFGQLLKFFVLSTITFFIYTPWGIVSLIKNVLKNLDHPEGIKLTTSLTGGKLFLKSLLWGLLTVVTLGIFALFIPNKMLKYFFINLHVHKKDGTSFVIKSHGDTWGTIWRPIVYGLATVLTLFITATYFTLKLAKFIVDKYVTIPEGEGVIIKDRFTTSSIEERENFVGYTFLQELLVIVTLGIYGFKATINIYNELMLFLDVSLIASPTPIEAVTE